MIANSVQARKRPSLRAIITIGLIASWPRLAPAQISQARPVITTVLKVAAVVTAAKFAEETSVSLNDYWAGAAPTGESIYSVAFNFDRSSWADFWSGPDMFLVVECEGAKQYVVPEIEYDWGYGTKIYTFRCPTLPNGSRCVLKLYDDDSASDKIWKNVLSTRVNWTAGASASAKATAPILPQAGTACIEAKAAADGKLELLTANEAQHLVLDAPDLMASAEFTVPNAAAGDKWDMDGVFTNKSKVMGKVHLTHWWTGLNRKPLLPSKVVFWGVLLVGLVGLAAFGFAQTKSRSTEEGKA